MVLIAVEECLCSAESPKNAGQVIGRWGRGRDSDQAGGDVVRASLASLVESHSRGEEEGVLVADWHHPPLVVAAPPPD